MSPRALRWRRSNPSPRCRSRQRNPKATLNSSLAPLLRGEGWGEGPLPQVSHDEVRAVSPPPPRSPKAARPPPPPRGGGKKKQHIPFTFHARDGTAAHTPTH